MDQQQTLICPSHTTQYIGTLLIGVLVGIGATFIYLNQAPSGSENTYQAGFDAAKKLVEESSVGPMLQAVADVRYLSGTVTGVQGNRITIRTQSMNPFDDPLFADRTVLVNADTKIFKLAQKDSKVMQAEMEAFAKTMQAGKNMTQPATPPEPFTRTPSAMADIAVGDMLNVTSAENIKSLKEFLAVDIRIQPNMMPSITN